MYSFVLISSFHATSELLVLSIDGSMCCCQTAVSSVPVQDHAPSGVTRPRPVCGNDLLLKIKISPRETGFNPRCPSGERDNLYVPAIECLQGKIHVHVKLSSPTSSRGSMRGDLRPRQRGQMLRYRVDPRESRTQMVKSRAKTFCTALCMARQD